MPVTPFKHFCHFCSIPVLSQGRPETVLRPMQASIFTPLLRVPLKLALKVVAIFLVFYAPEGCALVGRLVCLVVKRPALPIIPLY